MAEAKRRIIYVDAGQNKNKEFQIALFDPEINLTSIVKLLNIDNNNIAEKYAVVNAITYIKIDWSGLNVYSINLSFGKLYCK